MGENTGGDYLIMTIFPMYAKIRHIYTYPDYLMVPECIRNRLTNSIDYFDDNQLVSTSNANGYC